MVKYGFKFKDPLMVL